MLRGLCLDLRSQEASADEMRRRGRLAHKPEVEREPALSFRGTVGLFVGVIGDSAGSDSSRASVSSPTLDVVARRKNGQPGVWADCAGGSSSNADSVDFTQLDPVAGMSISR
jgi:hypothetical protein